MSATVFALMAVVMHNLPGVRDECGRAGARPSRAGQRARRPLSQYAAAQERGPPHGEPPSWQRETQMNGRAARSTGGVRCLRREDGFHAGGIVDEFEEIRLLRRIGIIHEKSRGDLPAFGVKHVSGVRTADAPPPRDHLSSVPVVTEKLDNAFHAHLASTEAFPVIVSACGQVQWRFQLASAAALLVLA